VPDVLVIIVAGPSPIAVALAVAGPAPIVVKMTAVSVVRPVAVRPGAVPVVVPVVPVVVAVVAAVLRNPITTGVVVVVVVWDVNRFCVGEFGRAVRGQHCAEAGNVAGTGRRPGTGSELHQLLAGIEDFSDSGRRGRGGLGNPGRRSERERRRHRRGPGQQGLRDDGDRAQGSDGQRGGRDRRGGAAHGVGPPGDRPCWRQHDSPGQVVVQPPQALKYWTVVIGHSFSRSGADR
jgi:hypothetical protein